MSEPTLTAMGIVRARTGQEEELGRRMAALIAPTCAEPGCIAYQLFRSADDPALWMLLEQWRSTADLEAHIDSPHLQAFLRTKDEVVAAAPDNYRWVRYPAPK
jgi:quinol monooxygenase YgiN